MKIQVISNIVNLLIKQTGYRVAKEKFQKIPKVELKTLPNKVGLSSKLCVQNDIESYWYSYWCNKLKLAPIYHRKPWEFAYIAQVAYEHGILTPGKKAIAFGCGGEPLSALFCSYGVSVLATDAPSEEVANTWSETGQYGSFEHLVKKDICEESEFRKLCTFDKVDMNDLNPIIAKNEKFDFVWSACALEHLGSIEKGLVFIEKSVECLAPGGVAVHTTEFSLTGKFVDNVGAVNFTKDHMEDLKRRLEKKGFEVSSFDYSKGNGVLDAYIDLPPCGGVMDQDKESVAHLRLLVNDIPCTSIGIIIKKPK